MASKKWKSGLKSLNNPTISPDQRRIVADELVTEIVREANDRGAALILGTFVEEALRQAVVRRFTASDASTLFAPDSALSSFHILTAIGYGLGVIDKPLREDVDRIREIRKTFAHCRFPINFDTPEIAEACVGFDIGTFTLKGLPDSMNDSKRRYVLASFRLLSELRRRDTNAKA